MKSPIRSLVFDLGAGSGRAIVAELSASRIILREVHRFDSAEIDEEDGPHWDVPSLKREIEEGMRRARRLSGEIDSIGVDSWGLDYALVGEDGLPIVAPYHYRHPRSYRGREAFPLDPEILFRMTGSQDLPVNTVYQLFDEAKHHPERVQRAMALLMMADVVNHHLTGQLRSERTLARTSGLLDVRSGEWSEALCQIVGAPRRLFQPLISPGDTYGVLRPTIAERTGWRQTPVITVGGHDTASAVAALSLDDGSGFLVAGSWLLIGVELDAPRVDEAVWQAGFGNEGGVGNRTILVKSLNGLHLIRLLQAAWLRRRGVDVSFAEISRLANATLEQQPIVGIDATDPLFFNPTDIIEAIELFGSRRGLVVTDDLGWLAAMIYRGVAEQVGDSIKALERLLDRSIPSLRVCGGGGRDATLCKLVASIIGRPIRVGPIEVTAWGNSIVQFIALGAVPSLDEGRRLIEHSAEFCSYPHECNAFSPANKVNA